MGDPAQLDLPEQDTVAACYAAAGRFQQAAERVFVIGHIEARLGSLREDGLEGIGG